MRKPTHPPPIARPVRAWMTLTALTALFTFVSAQPVPVPTYTVQSAPAGSAFVLDGVIEPVRQSTVSAQASGRIVALLVKNGDKVAAGQLLATIDDREAVVDTQQSQAQADQADADLRNARAAFERTRELQTKGFVSQAARDTAEAQFQSATARRAQADAAQRQSGLARGYTRVTAPFAGWVLQTDAQVGDLAVPGKSLLVLYAPLPLRAVVQVPASRAQLLGAGSTVQIQTGDIAAGGWITPTGRSAAPGADPVSQTVQWRLDLPPGPSAGLLPGQQVRVQFTTPAAPTAEASATSLRVPAQALVRRGELTAVYVVSGTGFALRAVRLGAGAQAGQAEVLAGLKAGDVIALDPLRAAQAGATTVPVK